MNTEKLKKNLNEIYKESRSVETQLNRGGITQKDGIQSTLCLVRDLTTIISELLQNV